MVAKKRAQKVKNNKIYEKRKGYAFMIRLEILYTVNSKLNAKN